MSKVTRTYRFGNFELDASERRLLHHGAEIPLRLKVFEILLLLVENAGHLLTREELLQRVWSDVAVEENNLSAVVCNLRKSLGESATGQAYIETVPRVGYRFVAPVKEINPAPRPQPAASRQQIRFCRTSDNVRLAYSTTGTGYPIVRTANCFNHLDFEWDGATWRHWVKDLAPHFSILRYDGRSNGLSDWEVNDISFEAWVRDLETVVDAAGVEKFALVGASQGGAVSIAYAIRHPERVSHLILCGAYSRGTEYRDRPDALQVRRALQTLVQLDWGRYNPNFFNLVTNLYIPEHAEAEDQEWFNDLQRRSTSPGNLSRVMRVCDGINVRALLPLVTSPTLVFHSDRDRVAPQDEGRLLAAEIPDARFVPLSSGNHLLVGDEPAWDVFVQEITAFLPGRDLRGEGSRAAGTKAAVLQMAGRSS